MKDFHPPYEYSGTDEMGIIHRVWRGKGADSGERGKAELAHGQALITFSNPQH
jgi:hypothetical protein